MRVLCFGDSNTYGYAPYDARLSEEQRWTGRLQRSFPHWELTEAGQNGRMISGGPRQWPELSADLVMAEHLRRCRPELLILMLGSNDALYFTAADIAASLSRLLDVIRSVSDTRVLLIAPPHGRMMNRRTVAQLAPLYARIAAAQGCLFADSEQWCIDLACDGGHFSPAGHAAFADRLAALLRKSLGEQEAPLAASPLT